MTGTTAATTGIHRRFVALTALRWLPTGLLIPVLVVLMQARGLGLAQVGLVSAAASTVVLVLELPTGGLADAAGRRPVLVAASLLDVASLALVAAAHSPGAFLVAWMVQGVYRALESGPLEAWYVDSAQAADPEADIERGLAHAGTAAGGAIAAGALVTAVLTTWPPGGVDPLVVPVLAALTLRVIDVVALAALLREPTRRGRGLTAAGAAVAGAPAVVGRTARLMARSPTLLALAGVELSWGAGLVAVELFSAPRMVSLVGDATGGVAAYALAAAAGWAVCAVGSAFTGRVVAGAGGGSPARAGARLRVVQGAAAAVMAAVGGPGAFVAGYLGFYLVHGTANVVHYGMVHRAVGPDHRTTVLSANSLASRAGGIVAALALGVVADRAGAAWALLAGAVVLAAAAPLYGIAGRSAPASAAERIGRSPGPTRGDLGREQQLDSSADRRCGTVTGSDVTHPRSVSAAERVGRSPGPRAAT
ncbi:MAG TPA: MFS transporter [Acidimicrobiales bacterium]|nr:MFS transporter [Acidimicrobiales bacterium]